MDWLEAVAFALFIGAQFSAAIFVSGRREYLDPQYQRPSSREARTNTPPQESHRPKTQTATQMA